MKREQTLFVVWDETGHNGTNAWNDQKFEHGERRSYRKIREHDAVVTARPSLSSGGADNFKRKLEQHKKTTLNSLNSYSIFKTRHGCVQDIAYWHKTKVYIWVWRGFFQKVNTRCYKHTLWHLHDFPQLIVAYWPPTQSWLPVSNQQWL